MSTEILTRISMYTNPAQSGIVHVDNRGGAPFFGKNFKHAMTPPSLIPQAAERVFPAFCVRQWRM